MSARDDAAKVMRDYHHSFGWEFYDTFFEDSLDQIPSDVLLRLAEERGVLQAVTIGMGSPAGDLFIVETGETYDEHEDVLYKECEP